jgi:hypothetical protein
MGNAAEVVGGLFGERAVGAELLAQALDLLGRGIRGRHPCGGITGNIGQEEDHHEHQQQHDDSVAQSRDEESQRRDSLAGRGHWTVCDLS